MILRAWSFVMTMPETGNLVGLAVVCAEVQYAGVCWVQSQRIESRFASPDEWAEIRHQLDISVSPGPLPITSSLLVVLAGARAVRVQYLHAMDLEVAGPEQTVAALDAHLLGQLDF